MVRVWWGSLCRWSLTLPAARPSPVATEGSGSSQRASEGCPNGPTGTVPGDHPVSDTAGDASAKNVGQITSDGSLVFEGSMSAFFALQRLQMTSTAGRTVGVPFPARSDFSRAPAGLEYPSPRALLPARVPELNALQPAGPFKAAGFCSGTSAWRYLELPLPPPAVANTAPCPRNSASNSGARGTAVFCKEG